MDGKMPVTLATVLHRSIGENMMTWVGVNPALDVDGDSRLGLQDISSQEWEGPRHRDSHVFDFRKDDLSVVLKLFIVSISEKVREIGNHTIFVLSEDCMNGGAFLGVGHEDLENVEGFVLNVFATIQKEVHNEFEIVRG
mmetsp:Transcript_8093/g.16286  ORF Transcript_8093/g.16286 Transcript_8093/m.16286 type:complete len:139 (-) Transcript_8093:1095-1511(-)